MSHPTFPTARLLSPEQLRELEALLRAQARRLEATMALHLHHDGELGTPVAAEDTDRAVRETDLDTALNELEREAQEEQAVAAALQRLADGSYGACIDCGEPIGFERLLAHPTASRCLSCQTRHESKYRS